MEIALEKVVGAELQIGPERSYRVLTEAVRMGRGILDEVGALVAKHLGVGHILVIADHNTYPPNGPAVEASLRAVGCRVHWLLLEDGHDGKVEADEWAVALVEKRIEDLGESCIGLLALGAGTVNDLAKLPAYRKGLPYGVVATAASMNGFTSAIAAILEGGVKRTISCAPPRFVLADMDVVATAPLEMTRSGLGDLMSKPVSSGDWRLSHLLLGETFHELPVRLVESAFRRTQDYAAAIGKGDPDAVNHLMEALLLSGISMASAGSSSPASGGEHLISHLWDMTAAYRGRKVGLHGAQVGVATLVSATLYQFLRDIRLGSNEVGLRLEGLESFEAHSRRLNSLPAEIRSSVEVESRKKHPSPDGLRKRLADVRERSDDIWTDLAAYLQSPDSLRETLAAAGAPISVRELGISESEMREAYRIARDIRTRYTVLDFAWELGCLDALEERVLGSAGVLD